MNRETFATKVLRLKKRQHFDYVLSGKRNLSFSRAKIAAGVLNTDVVVWIDPDRATDRQAAWENYAENKEAAA